MRLADGLEGRIHPLGHLILIVSRHVLRQRLGVDPAPGFLEALRQTLGVSKDAVGNGNGSFHTASITTARATGQPAISNALARWPAGPRAQEVNSSAPSTNTWAMMVEQWVVAASNSTCKTPSVGSATVGTGVQSCFEMIRSCADTRRTAIRATMDAAAIRAIADRLIAAYDGATTLAPISAATPGFDVAAAYDVLREIEARRIAQGWRAVGRKIGFTNRTLWPRYGVYQPMWAHTWAHTVRYAAESRARLSLAGLVQPRIEPEVVFKLAAAVPGDADMRAVLAAVEWIAAGFEIAQSHFPEWRFTAADCTAAFGLHGALAIGTPTRLTETNREAIAAALPTFRLTLRKEDTVVDTGVGSNVLDSPALALAHLANVLATQLGSPPLVAGEVITTGTLTDAWPVTSGETWSSDYGALPVAGLTLMLD